MTHTPGPWEVVSPERMNAAHITISGLDPEGARFQPIAAIMSGGTTPHLKISQEQKEANARLIAAAPDLLSKLQIMVAVFNKRTSDIDSLQAFAAIEQARAAIDKATK